MRILPVVLGASLLVAASAYPGTCYHSFIAEGAAPPAFDGINPRGDGVYVVPLGLGGKHL